MAKSGTWGVLRQFQQPHRLSKPPGVLFEHRGAVHIRRPPVAAKKHHPPVWQPVGPVPPAGPTVDAYQLAGYVDGMVGAAKPGCDILRPRYDSGLKWPDKNNPRHDDPLWGAGVRAGIKWDGTFYRDLSRYGQSGSLFWAAYLKPGTGPGIKNGY